MISLPCRGCKHCQRLHTLWERIEEDVNNVVPLALRNIKLGEEADEMTSIGQTGEGQTEAPLET